MKYLDGYSEEDWHALLSELAKDAHDFYSAEKPWDRDAYLKNITAIKQKTLPAAGRSLEDIIADIRSSIVPGAIHQHHRNYIAFPDKGSLVAPQYASMLAGVMNQNLIAEDKSAPTGTYIEMRVISWLRQLIGYSETDVFPGSSLELGGAFVTGGVMANTYGLLAARQRALPDTKAKGMQAISGTPKIFVAGPTMSHYSHFGAAWWLGFGTDNVIEVACDDKGNMDKTDLTERIEQTLSGGDIPVAIVALAGDSRTNTVDDFPGLYAIAQRYGVWLHADACHGGLLLFDDTFRHDGKHYLWYTDSITIDPHKHLGIPYSSSIVLFKDPHDLAAIGSSTDITIAYGSNDIGQVTPFLGSRTFDALKFYVAIQQYGIKGIRENIRARKAITWEWHDLLEQSPVLQPLHEPELFAQAFSLRHDGLAPAELSRRNRQLHDKLHAEGIVIAHMFNMRDYRNRLGYGKGTEIKALGSLFGSDVYTAQDLKDILTVVERTARDLGF